MMVNIFADSLTATLIDGILASTASAQIFDLRLKLGKVFSTLPGEQLLLMVMIVISTIGSLVGGLVTWFLAPALAGTSSASTSASSFTIGINHMAIIDILVVLLLMAYVNGFGFGMLVAISLAPHIG